MTDTITLTPATLAHCRLLAGMHAICFAEPWSEAAMAETLVMPGVVGLLAVDGDSLTPAMTPPGPAGFVLWRVVAGEAEILSIAVLPPWRHLGLGGRLLGAALTASAATGAEAMFLEVAVNNGAAQSLYGRTGFSVVGRRRGYYGDTDALVMRRDLIAAA